jgi:hypothetical protein
MKICSDRKINSINQKYKHDKHRGLILAVMFWFTAELNYFVLSQRNIWSSIIRWTGTRCKIWGFHGSDYEECRPLGYKPPVRTSQETPYFSTTESSQLMLCKIWGFHGSDIDECRPLGYKPPVRTSQETPYFSTTESSQLMLCKIWGFHCGDYEEWCLLGCYAVWVL